MSSNGTSNSNPKDYRIKNGQTHHKASSKRLSSQQKNKVDFENSFPEKFALKNETNSIEKGNQKNLKKTGNDIQKFADPQFQKTKENKFKIVKFQNNFLPQNNNSFFNDFPSQKVDGSNVDIQQTKKLLYLYNNEIKAEFNSLVLENKQIETKIKQMRKERETIEKELVSGKELHFKSSSVKKSVIKIEAQQLLKETLKKKKDAADNLKNEFKNLKYLLKDENLTNLKNQNICLVNSLTKLKETLIEELNDQAELNNNDEENKTELKLTLKNFTECEKILEKTKNKKQKLEVD